MLSHTQSTDAGFGLDLCAAGIDPLTDYVDLVMQRHLLGSLWVPGWTLLTVDTLDRAILQTQASRDSAKCAEDTSQRYWSLKWLEQSGLHDISCVVVQPRGPGYLVALDGGPAGAFAPASRGERLEAEPGQRLQLRIEKVSARINLLELADPKLQ